MSRGLKDLMGFGKHKEKTIEDLYNTDASYLCWARDWKRDKCSQPDYFDLEVHQLLDLTIKEDSYLRGKFLPWNVKPPEGAPEPEPQVAPSYAGWGEF